MTEALEREMTGSLEREMTESLEREVPRVWGRQKSLILELCDIIEKCTFRSSAPSTAAAAGGRVMPGGPGTVW